ncbi:MAG: hypothetical protein IPM63_18350 [Acidobacteriota bacterium]|nr:MAG: hypothetical protein IPM63_18350 [Acidobacteriota bacterium]
MRMLQSGVCAAFLLCLAAAVSGQTKTVTNADLEKYREKRVAAEKDLRENYEELGFASPEERAQRIEEYRRQKAELVDELRERDRVVVVQDDDLYQGPQVMFPYPNPNFVDYGGRIAPSYFYYRFYYPYGNKRYNRYPRGYTRYGRDTFRPGQFRTLRRLLREARRGRP